MSTRRLRMVWSETQRKRAGESWRPFSDAPFWHDFDAVVFSAGGRQRVFEVYTFGQLVATRPTLDEAKAYVEDVYGSLPWRQVDLPKVVVEHPAFGKTDEFTTPTRIFVVDHLPSLLEGRPT